MMNRKPFIPEGGIEWRTCAAKLLNTLGTKERPGPGDPGHCLLRLTAASETTYCHYLVFEFTMVREMVVLFVMPSPVPVMVMV